MKKFLVVLMFLSAGVVLAQDTSVASPAPGVEAGKPSKEQRKAMKEELKDEREAVNVACAEEAKAANCGEKTVGKGLLKCINAHKKASSEFKVSDSCKTAMKSLREERKKVKNN